MSTLDPEVDDIPYASNLKKIIEKLLEDEKQGGLYCISEIRLDGVVKETTQRIIYLATQHNEHLTITKYCGICCFYFYQFAPIVRKTKDLPPSETSDAETLKLNLKVAIWFAVKLIPYAYKMEPRFVDINIGDACKGCNGIRCVETYIHRLFSYNNNYSLDYLFHIMSEKCISAEAITAMLDHLLFAACDGSRNGIRKHRNPELHPIA